MSGWQDGQPCVGRHEEVDLGLKASGCGTKRLPNNNEGKNMEQSKKGTPDQAIAHEAKVWRQHDIVASADKKHHGKQIAEYRARQNLRETIDTTRES